MKITTSIVSIISLLIPQTGAWAQVTKKQEIAKIKQELCRLPNSLPVLALEAEAQPQRPIRPTPRRGVSAPPPPEPMGSYEMAADAAEDIVVTGTKMARTMEAGSPMAVVAADSAGSDSAAASSAMPSYTSPSERRFPPSPSVQQPQSGLLTAGEHDDLLNPELYAQYVKRSDLGQNLANLPRLDTARLLTVEAKDSSGRPVGLVPVDVRCSDGSQITLGTVADGKAIFFPELDRLGNSVHVRAGKGEWRKVDLSGSNGSQTVTFTMKQNSAQAKKLDLALVVDVTGSMDDELQFLQRELEAMVGALSKRHKGVDIQVGFVFYRDKGDDFTTRTFAFDKDIQKATHTIAQQSANGGGDYEEAVQEALIRANSLNWREDAVKSLLFVADAPPHDGDIRQTWDAAENLRHKRVQIIPVGASGVADMSEYLMRGMAALTQSRYVFLTDDSGIGNAHAKPAIDCYLVTRLDNLLSRIIDSQISGNRIEPENQEIIRMVGQYDHGRCILPKNFDGN